MSAISGEIASIQKILDSEGLTHKNFKSIEARVERLAGSIKFAIDVTDISKFFALKETIETIKPTLFIPESKESKQREVSTGSKMSSASKLSQKEYQAFLREGVKIAEKHNTGKLPRKDAEAYVTRIYALLSVVSDKDLPELSHLVKFGEKICPGFKIPVFEVAAHPPYVFQGERVLATGGVNQFSWAQGSKASCASNAVNFIARTFSEDPDQFTGKDVREIIQSGKALFDQVALSQQRAQIQKLASEAGAAVRLELLATKIGHQHGAGAKQTFLNTYERGELDPQTKKEYDDEALRLYGAEGAAAEKAFLKANLSDNMAPVEVIPLYQARLGECPHSPPAKILPHNDPKGVKDHFRHTIDNVLKPHIPLGGRVGTTINCNGATHAMTIVRGHDDTYKFYIFDSHGRGKLNGTKAGFLYKTDSKDDAIEYLSRVVSIGKPYKKASLNPQDLNKISYAIIKPPVGAQGPLHDPLDEKEAWVGSSRPPLHAAAPQVAPSQVAQQVAAPKQQGTSTAMKVLGVAALVFGLIGSYVLPSYLPK